jgi:hypothetical protein
VVLRRDVMHHVSSNGIHLRRVRHLRGEVADSILRLTSSCRSDRISWSSADSRSYDASHAFASLESRPRSRLCRSRIAASASFPDRRIASSASCQVSLMRDTDHGRLTSTASSLSLHHSSYLGVSPVSHFRPSHIVGTFIAHLCRNSNLSFVSGPFRSSEASNFHQRCFPTKDRLTKNIISAIADHILHQLWPQSTIPNSTLCLVTADIHHHACLSS